MPTESFVSQVNDLAERCCHFVGKDPKHPYVKGARKGQSRDVWEFNHLVVELWNLIEPYVIKSVMNATKVYDEDTMSLIKLTILRTLRDFGPYANPTGGFIGTVRKVIGSTLKNRVIASYKGIHRRRDVEFVRVSTGRRITYVPKLPFPISKKLQSDESLQTEIQYWQADTMTRNTVDSLDEPVGGEESTASLGDTIGCVDAGISKFELTYSTSEKEQKVLEAILTAGTITDATKMLNRRMHIHITRQEVKNIAIKYVRAESNEV